ncbi:GspH/FimT family pseudopilin [Rhodanobacter sp. C03]|uniref:GspH/FimT family pseudopilin n=1 Tax=Rhodanobacter sp. C03 TaxID=1945858 RepID=UPI0009C47A3C|nr:GspH/FimT family pseudopilin [Rhodanobacter sp. C03]OOG57272.1 hypothetical protein B0E48_07360 [Rhodanobacter sp. C03]
MKLSSQQGFSLIELMTTIVILAILVVLGFPSYQAWIRNTGIRNAAESIQNGLRQARNEASQRGTTVRFELNTAGTADWTVCVLPSTATACAGGTTLQVFTASGGASAVQITASTAVADATTLATALAGASTAASGVTFNALGRPTAYGTTSLLRIDASSTMANTRRLVTTISPGGMVRMCDPLITFSATSPQGCQ